jgi:hypothetical protein
MTERPGVWWYKDYSLQCVMTREDGLLESSRDPCSTYRAIFCEVSRKCLQN